MRSLKIKIQTFINKKKIKSLIESKRRKIVPRGDVLRISINKPTIKLSETLLLVIVIFVSVVSTLVFFKLNLIVAYNDARSHLNMSRLVIDNLKPGLAQIGSVWLPLNHILYLPLIWNDFLWRTGLAGSVISMLCFILSSMLIYKLINLFIENKLVAILGVSVFITNLNILYMQSTPMTELILIFFFLATAYFLTKWAYTEKYIYLILTALSVFLATLTRYDGWFLFLFVALSVGVLEFEKLQKRLEIFSGFFKKLKTAAPQIEGKTVLFVTLAGFGIFLWFLWNLLIFKDPLYFAFGPYSAHSQQIRIEEAGSLPTKYNFFLSVKAYWWAMIDNAGLFILIFATIGFIVFFVKNKLKMKAISLYVLIVPLVFHVISLYLGHSILVLPELGINVTEKASGSWFNVR